MTYQTVEPPSDFEMYTDEADAYCQAACVTLNFIVKEGAIRNREELAMVARALVRDITTHHREMGDTEPRSIFSEWLDSICAANGWAFEPSESYDLP